jgi:hypothetical protein
MTWAILDPRLFENHDRVEDVLRQVVAVLRYSGAVVPETRPYWPLLEKEAFSPLRRQARHIDEIRSYRRRHGLEAPFPKAPVAGLDRLLQGTKTVWGPVLEDLVLACASKDETILVTRLIEGRNLKRHIDQDNREVLREKTLWEIRTDFKHRPIRIPLICVERNLRVPWTTRLDEALPASQDGSIFPFCPPIDWREDGAVYGTTKARPCWNEEGRKRSWAHPRTPGEPRHWDVYLNTPELQEEYGLQYLNVVRFGGPPGEGSPGHLHHVPTQKEGKLRKRAGWKC